MNVKWNFEFQSRQIRKKQETLMAKIKEATVKIPKAPEQKVIKSLRKQQLILNQKYRHLDKNSWKSSTRNFF